jgi:hypothetical protein
MTDHTAHASEQITKLRREIEGSQGPNVIYRSQKFHRHQQSVQPSPMQAESVMDAARAGCARSDCLLDSDPGRPSARNLRCLTRRIGCWIERTLAVVCKIDNSENSPSNLHLHGYGKYRIASGRESTLKALGWSAIPVNAFSCVRWCSARSFTLGHVRLA